MEQVSERENGREDARAVAEATGILAAVYGHAWDEETYRIQYYENPSRLKRPIRIHYENGKPAGLIAHLGMRLRLGDRELLVSQTCDVAVVPEARGKHVFQRMLRQIGAEEGEAAFDIGMPNEQSFGRMLEMGYTAVAQLSHFIYVLRPGSFLFGKNAAGRAIDRLWKPFVRGAFAETELKRYGIQIRESDSCPFSEKEMQRINRGIRYGFLRSTTLYRWKEAYNPQIRFHYAALYRNGELQAGVVYHLRPRKRGNVIVVDDHFMPAKASLRKKYLQMLLVHIQGSGDMIEVPFVNMNTPEVGLFQSLHFINACRKPFGLRGSPLIVSAEGKAYPEIKNCCLHNIDSDVI